jgi:hypothetical protein
MIICFDNQKTSHHPDGASSQEPFYNKVTGERAGPKKPAFFWVIIIFD